MSHARLETNIEKDYVHYAATRGVLALKLSIPGRRNYPDRLNLCGNGYVFFIEFKRKGEEPRPAQLSNHRKLRARGYNVYVCDTLEQAKKVLDGELLLAP